MQNEFSMRKIRISKNQQTEKYFLIINNIKMLSGVNENLRL